MDKELSVSKFSVSLLEMSGGVEASALQMATPDSDNLDDQKPQPGMAWSSATMSVGARWQEVYCLTMRVTCNMG